MRRSRAAAPSVSSSSSRTTLVITRLSSPERCLNTSVRRLGSTTCPPPSLATRRGPAAGTSGSQAPARQPTHGPPCSNYETQLTTLTAVHAASPTTPSNLAHPCSVASRPLGVGPKTRNFGGECFQGWGLGASSPRS